ncbi:MAG TPA: asparagine synthetase B, partial [Candidatus Wallbacteria bacterium]|nr:asparagine synthetase B [Candidatus Wallbacteria bacterium]
MCRIAGFIEFHKSSGYDHERVINDMRDSMIYGGPDDAGNYLNAENGVALGHRRLSIIDLSPSGHQPMTDGELVIIFNGEIYNYEVHLR